LELNTSPYEPFKREMTLTATMALFQRPSP
jgi:hypothetical protein